MQNPDTWINLTFSVRLAERYEQAEAKTTKDQTIRKRTEPAFIEPMQCKPVTVLPTEQPQWEPLLEFIRQTAERYLPSPPATAWPDLFGDAEPQEPALPRGSDEEL